MKINLDEINSFADYMNGNEYADLVAEIEESDSYMEVLDNLTLDLKLVVSEYLRNAVSCHFDSEILRKNYKIPNEIIEYLLAYKNSELEVNL